MKSKIIIIDADFDARYESNECGVNIPFFAYHSVFEIYVLETGLRTVVIGDKMYETKPMTAVMLPSNVLHRSFGDTPYSGICFHFSERYIDLYYSTHAKAQFLKAFTCPVIPLATDDISALKDTALKIQENPTWKFLCLGRVMEIINAAADKISESPVPLNSSENYKTHKFSAVLAYVNDNYTKIKNYSDLCVMFDISEGYLYRGFKKHLGMTVSQYINTLRIQYACRELKNSKNRGTVRHLAEQCGFESDSYFIRTFKKIMNCTPTEYRNKGTVCAMGVP